MAASGNQPPRQSSRLLRLCWGYSRHRSDNVGLPHYELAQYPLSHPSHRDPLRIKLTFRTGKTPTTTVESQRGGCIGGETPTSSLRARLQDNLAGFVFNMAFELGAVCAELHVSHPRAARQYQPSPGRNQWGRTGRGAVRVSRGWHVVAVANLANLARPSASNDCCMSTLGVVQVQA